MASKKYTSILVGITLALVVITGVGLAAFRINNDGQTNTTQTIRATTVSYHGTSNGNALNLLKQHYTVKTKTYTGMGEEVIGINGVVASSKQYWAFYVNGKEAQVGAGSYTTKKTDTITWKLESL